MALGTFLCNFWQWIDRAAVPNIEWYGLHVLKRAREGLKKTAEGYSQRFVNGVIRVILSVLPQREEVMDQMVSEGLQETGWEDGQSQIS